MASEQFLTTLLELLWVFGTYYYVIAFQTLRRTIPITKKSFKPSRNISLLFHLGLPILEILRYHLRMLYSQAMPGFTDLFLCLAHSVTAYQLTRDRHLGDKILARPTLQTIALLRIIFSILGFTQNSHFYYRASIRIVNGFAYPRICIRIMQNLHLLPSYSSSYTAANFIGVIVSMHDTGVPLGPHLFLVVFLLNIIINRWAATMVMEQGDDRVPIVPRALHRLGFAELKILQSKPPQSAPEVPMSPIDQNLSNQLVKHFPSPRGQRISHEKSQLSVYQDLAWAHPIRRNLLRDQALDQHTTISHIDGRQLQRAGFLSIVISPNRQLLDNKAGFFMILAPLTATHQRNKTSSQQMTHDIITPHYQLPNEQTEFFLIPFRIV